VQGIASAGTRGALGALRGAALRGATLRGALACIAGALGSLRFDLAHGFFQSKPFACDLGFGKRRLHAAKLRDQRCARPLIERTTAFAWSIGIQGSDSFGDQRMVIGHFNSDFMRPSR